MFLTLKYAIHAVKNFLACNITEMWSATDIFITFRRNRNVRGTQKLQFKELTETLLQDKFFL